MKIGLKVLSVALLGMLFIGQPLMAKVRLPKLVSDKMVLQRDAELKIWGWADAGEPVTVRFLGAYYETQADKNGEWMVTLPPQKAGGPYILEVNDIVIRDVLVGDVSALVKYVPKSSHAVSSISSILMLTSIARILVAYAFA